MKRIIEIEPQLDLRIEQILRNKGYRDFQHFASISLENQVIAETDDENSWNIDQDKIIFDNSKFETKHIETLYLLPSNSIKTIEPPTNEMLVDLLLWGQYCRFLPAKFGVRVLANLSSTKLPLLSDFIEGSISSALLFRRTLNRIDNRQRNDFGEKISTGFPEGTEKSIRRFREHFLISIRKSTSKLDGMLSRLKFINIFLKDGEEYVGLTNYGKQFAELKNYVLDEGKNQSLSYEETQFLLTHILLNLPDEANHMRTIIQFVKSGNKSRNELNLVLGKYYEEYFEGIEWSDNIVNTMRAGLLGRLLEMGLIKRHKNGKYITYSLTEIGEKFSDASVNPINKNRNYLSNEDLKKVAEIYNENNNNFQGKFRVEE